MTSQTSVGFIGLGTMGLPMALNLLRAGTPLVLWNRTVDRSGPAVRAGGVLAPDAADVFARCGTVILMLADGAATDSVLARRTSDFTARVRGRRIVAMGTLSPDYSRALASDIRAAGGRYVEAPVSGSRKPAEAGQLVAMLAGDPSDVAAVRPLLAPLCRQIVDCGDAPDALRMKLAVNIVLITLVTGLAEAAHFVRILRLDPDRFSAILDAGPMASEVSGVKVAKLLSQDFERQAGISDVLKNVRLVTDAARQSAIATPLMDVCRALYAETEELGLSHEDMVAVVRAIEGRTAVLS